MAVYKVPQDVEADDKLIGPFSFRQFIYLIIVALSIAAAWGLSQVFLPLLLIPMPLIIFFGALALPLRKDQPMEVYMAAIVSFYLKPHKRIWDPDGIESLIEITVPKVVEVQRTKNISQNEAQQRFGYLADIVDSQGWAVRGQGVQAPNSALTNDVYFEAQQVEDILDSSNNIAQSLDYMIGKTDSRRHEEMMERIKQQAAAAPAAVPTPAPVAQTPPADDPTLASTNPYQAPAYNPYPDIQQSVIQPIHQMSPTLSPSQTTAATTSENTVSPDIINLANNADISIETIAHEANRINQQDMNEEVVISLR